jgi:hypothetical protein
LADLERHVSNPEGGPYAIFSKLASGVGNEELLLKFDHEIAFITDVSKNYLFFTVNETQTGSDIWYLPYRRRPNTEAFHQCAVQSGYSPPFSGWALGRVSIE